MLAPDKDTAPPVVARDLRKVYRHVVAVDGISFTLERGTVTALLGGNGAGKTTTIAMMLGLVVPTSGVVRVFESNETGRAFWRALGFGALMDVLERRL